MTGNLPQESHRASGRLLIIGITGGIASGKSTVARMFAGRGIRHLDADKLVHDLMHYDLKTIAKIADAFPEAVSSSSPLTGEQQSTSALARRAMREGASPRVEDPSRLARARLLSRKGRAETINRAALAEIISRFPERLATLEHILHPRVRALEETAIHQARRRHARALILDIPLLFETDAQALCDVTIAVHAPLVFRRRRAFARLGMTEQKWQKLMARQLPDQARNRQADVVIDTSLGKADTRRQVQRLKHLWKI